MDNFKENLNLNENNKDKEPITGEENENSGNRAENKGKFYIVLPDGTVEIFDSRRAMEEWIKNNRGNYQN